MRLGIDKVSLARRIEKLRTQETGDEEADIPRDPRQAAEESIQWHESASPSTSSTTSTLPPAISPSWKRARSDIFRAVVLAKVREIKQQREAEEAEQRTAMQGGRHGV